jgi:hypothetical protein
MKGLGYVGFGTVTQSAMTAGDFAPDGSDKKLLDLRLKQPGMSDNKDDLASLEWVVGVKWEKTFERDKAKPFQGIFANQNIFCLLRDTLSGRSGCTVTAFYQAQWQYVRFLI